MARRISLGGSSSRSSASESEAAESGQGVPIPSVMGRANEGGKSTGRRQIGLSIATRAFSATRAFRMILDIRETGILSFHHRLFTPFERFHVGRIKYAFSRLLRASRTDMRLCRGGGISAVFCNLAGTVI